MLLDTYLIAFYFYIGEIYFMNNEKREIIEPISFAIEPISFAEKPIYFFAKQKDERGVFQEIKLENSTLAGHVIPAGVDVKEYEKEYLKFLDRLNGVEINDANLQASEPSITKPTIVRNRSDVTEATNYELKPLYKRIYVDKAGKIDYDRNEIIVQILIKEKSQTIKDTFIIKYAELDKITKNIGKSFPSAIIYNKNDAKKVENDFREKTSQISVIMCYTDAGWQLINGKHIFVHRGCKIPRAEIMTKLELPFYKDYQQKDLETVWRNSLNLYANYEVATVLSVYSFLGVTYKLFDEAGFPPHFLLFLNGKTGSLKTTISKILYTQLSEEQYRQFPRRLDTDTQTSFERALVISGRDTVTLIDDYSPAKTMQKKSEMAGNLETIIRMVGDGSSKSRSNVELEDCRGEGVKGMVVLTGELRGKGLSSNLRCLYCELEREYVNLDVVTWFQKEKYAYTTLIEHFTNYLSREWITTVSFIKENVENKRRMAEEFLKERRLIDTLVILWIMSEIIGKFLVTYCGSSEKVVLNEISLMQKDMVGVVVRSELIANEESPARIFMKALVTMLSSKKIHITSQRLQLVELSVLDGFEDNNYIYLLPDNVYPNVKNWLRMSGVYFGVEMSQLGSILCNEGYAIATPNGTNKKLYYARIDVGEGRKVKFIKIPKHVIRELQESVEHID